MADVAAAGHFESRVLNFATCNRRKKKGEKKRAHERVRGSKAFCDTARAVVVRAFGFYVHIIERSIIAELNLSNLQGNRVENVPNVSSTV